MSLQDITFFYGANNTYLDVTSIVLSQLTLNGTACIPSGDLSRGMLFGDPLPNVLKRIKIIADKEYFFPDTLTVIWPPRKESPEHQLSKIHQSLKFNGGSLQEEYPEQLMATIFIPSNACVLELGSNIGRNTLTIASLLADPSKFVTMESDPNTCHQLERNLRLNNFSVKVEVAALSKRRLFQQGWLTLPEALPGTTEINTISFSDLQEKHQLQFDTLVADCEGALYYILLDDPDLLNNIKLIIMENDYGEIRHKQKVDEILIDKGFRRVYSQVGGWGPCENNFFETWARA